MHTSLLFLHLKERKISVFILIEKKKKKKEPTQTELSGEKKV